ncbi:MAG: flagellar hook-basal body complex protein [Thermodesulfobacteriota bacterium]
MGIQNLMYTGVNGLNTIAHNMDVLSDNVANVNTVSHKSTRANFQDILTNSYGNIGEVGNGAQISHISRSFEVGQFEATSNSTDMGINGNGFFMLRGPMDETAGYYTRDGQFRAADLTGSADAAYTLVTPEGYYVQGINLGSVTTPTNTVEDIIIQRQCLPSATERVTLAVNLTSDPANREDAASEINLYQSWDGTQANPIDDLTYDYRSIIRAYDDNGSAFDLTVYFDGTSTDAEHEFLVTCDPAMDGRLLDEATGTRYNDASPPAVRGAGALLYGRLSFNATGQLTDVRCWDVPADGNLQPTDANRLSLGRGESDYTFTFNTTGSGDDRIASLNFGTIAEPQAVTSPAGARTDASGTAAPPISALDTWANVYDARGNQPQAGDRINFTGFTGDGDPASLTYEIDLDTPVTDLLAQLEQTFACTAVLSDGQLQLRDNTLGQSQLAITAMTYTDAAGNPPSANPQLAQVFGEDNAEFTVQPGQAYTPSTAATTNYANESQTIFQSQDGFGRGYLEVLFVDNDGVINGRYSNGQTVAQAQVLLADFQNYNGLVFEDGNRFTAGDTAGDRTIGTAGSGSFGAVRGNSLEMSNVDLAQQFADLILTQRTFQANSASIKTANEIYEVAIRLKQ